MRTDVLAAMTAFCFVASATPGPNNLMLMTSGVNFGFRRTLPHLIGVVLGFTLMVALVGLGLDAVFSRFPALLPAMRYLGAAYMLWLAYRIATAGPLREGQSGGAPLGFFAAAAFQWVNPKGWVMAISALTTYSVVDNYARNVAIVALACFIVGVPTCSAWALLGGFGFLSLVGSLPYSAFYVALAEGLPQNIRGGAFATIYAVAIATFGGTAQLIVTWLIHVTGNALAPAWYMLLATAVGLAAMAMMRETAPIRDEKSAASGK